MHRTTDPITSKISGQETYCRKLNLQMSFLVGLRSLGTGTAQEVAEEAKVLGHIGLAESIRKRAYELERSGQITVCETRRCKVTGRAASVYRLSPEHLKGSNCANSITEEKRIYQDHARRQGSCTNGAESESVERKARI